MSARYVAEKHETAKCWCVRDSHTGAIAVYRNAHAFPLSKAAEAEAIAKELEHGRDLCAELRAALNA